MSFSSERKEHHSAIDSHSLLSLSVRGCSKIRTISIRPTLAGGVQVSLFLQPSLSSRLNCITAFTLGRLMATHWLGLLLLLKQAHQSAAVSVSDYFNRNDLLDVDTISTLSRTPTHNRFLVHATTFTSGSGSGSNTSTYNNADNKNDVLQNSNNNSDSDSQNMESDRFEFVAFLLWYLFLVFCCVVPTCCAYRRRRQMELRLTAQQQANLNQRLQHSNLYILSNMQRHANNSERIQQERKRILGEELNATTMVCPVNINILLIP